MKLLDRYVGTSVMITTLFGVVVLSLVLVLGNLFKEVLDLIINHDVPIRYVLLFMLYVLPFSFTFTIPWGFLTALLLTFGRMSADNELIALKSNGVSIPRTCLPVFLIAMVLTVFCFFINAEIAPRAENQMMTMIFRIATSNPMSMFQADEVVDQFPDRRVYVGAKDGQFLKNILVFELDEDAQPIKFVYAREGVLKPDPANKQLLMHLYNAHFEQRDEEEPRNFDKIRQGIVVEEGVFPISLAAMYQENERGRRLSSYTLMELLTALRDPEPMPRPGFEQNRLETQVELNKRFSVSLACLAFALVAIPLGITAHRKETSVGFAFSLAIAFTYFFFIIMADTFRDNAAAHPGLLIWMPNVLFMSLGAWMFYRLAKR